MMIPNNNMKLKHQAFYCRLTEAITPNMISVMIGILSALMINLLTNEQSNIRYLPPVVMLILSIIMLVRLLNLYEDFKSVFERKRRDESRLTGLHSTLPAEARTGSVARSDPELWQISVATDWRKYFLRLGSAFLLVLISIVVIGLTNYSIVANSAREKANFNNQLAIIEKKTIDIQATAANQDAELEKLAKLIQENSARPINLERNSGSPFEGAGNENRNIGRTGRRKNISHSR